MVTLVEFLSCVCVHRVLLDSQLDVGDQVLYKIFRIIKPCLKGAECSFFADITASLKISNGILKALGVTAHHETCSAQN